MGLDLKLPAALLLGLTLSLAVGCTSAKPRQDVWPQVEVLPSAPPQGLETQAATSVLRRGPDGMLYIVGGLDDRAKPGATFLARYSGEWPLEKLPRPPLAAGQITRRYSDDVALVQMMYSLPDTDLEKLEITWQDDISREDIGKGVGRVEAVEGEAEFPSDLELSLGKNLGVQPGDIYAIIHPEADNEEAAPNDLQLGKRLAGICLVQQVSDARATCRVWKGTLLHPLPSPPKAGDTALFLEHTFGAPPRQALVQFANIEGDDGSVREHLIEQMVHYLNTHAAANVTVEPVDADLDPTSSSFYRSENAVEYRGMPQLLVGAALLERDGEEHLVINYTGVGPASGPGMIAAPPEIGIDMGPADEVDGQTLRQIYGLLLSGVLVYRGQTSEALMHLRQLLADEEVQGELRWHLRDQYAMRWAALGHLDEALWLVLEDEAVAAKREDRLAVLNALGTRVRLYGMLDAPARATESAARYLKMRREGGADKLIVLSAVSMYAEMLMAQGEVAAAKEQVATLEQMCPEGCEGDLFSHLSSVYWSVPPDDQKLQDELLARLEELAGKRVAARASLRIYQGLQAMRDGYFEQALVAFLDAERLFGERKSTPGIARAKYFAFLAQLAMKEPLDAYKTATEVLTLASELRDYATASRIYDRLASVYLGLDFEDSPQTYIQIASRVLTSVYESQVANGDLGKSSETLFTIGTLFFKLGSLDDAQAVFQKAVVYAIRSTRFDIAAMSHLTLGLIARAKGDVETFRSEIQRAETMARLSGDPMVMEALQRALEPPKEEEDPVDTQLL